MLFIEPFTTTTTIHGTKKLRNSYCCDLRVARFYKFETFKYFVSPKLCVYSAYMQSCKHSKNFILYRKLKDKGKNKEGTKQKR